MDTRVQGKRAQGDFILHINGRFPAGHVGSVRTMHQGVADNLSFLFIPEGKRHSVGNEDMACDTGPETDGLVRRRGVLEIRPERRVADGREKLEVTLGKRVESIVIDILFAHRLQIGLVAAPRKGRIGEKPAAEHVVPAKSRHRVAPTDPELAHFVDILFVRRVVRIIIAAVAILMAVISERIRAPIEIDEQTVPVAETVGNLRVDIIEEIVGRKAQGTADQFHQPRMQDTAGKGEGGFLADGAFHMGLFRQEADGEAAMDSFGIAVVHADVHDARSTAAVPGRERALVQGDLLHRIGREDREQAQQVLSVIDGNAVQQEQVLVRAAAAHIHAGGARRTGLHAGKKLKGLEHVRFAQDHRRPLDDGLGNLQRAEAGGPDAGLFPAGHLGRPDPRVGNEGEILRTVLLHPKP